MHKRVKIDAPAKINLSFAITGKRPDGYHLVDSVMQTVTLYDTITISRMSGKGIFISCDRPGIPCNEENVAHLAARYFFDAFGAPDGALSIEIQKRIPEQAGLGGGSTDAAGVLAGLHSLLEVDAGIERLCEIGAKVGADVPFCLLGGTQRARGIGEQFENLPTLPDCEILIAKPRAGISTPESYRRYDQLENPQQPDIDRLLALLQAGSLPALAQAMGNVLEAVAQLPEIPQLRRIMEQNGALGSLMSGSGSAVFGIFDSKRTAKRCMRKLYNHAEGVFLVKPAQRGAWVFELQD
ncbi:MAG: 4-(cytidine 5'-diphospho)-2-C-methyl-D-erythritol kinase [Anaerotruncus sp.]|nr:4-(cytidine 5'-diphospho)-2-C-methyl-D-erythritol kinase [Anaerotruncus sp.]